MKVLKRLSAIILLIIAISSCNIQNGFIQRRKYQKGYHLSLKKKIAPPQNKEIETNETQEENLAIEKKTTNIIPFKENKIEKEVVSNLTEDLAIEAKTVNLDNKITKRKNLKSIINKYPSLLNAKNPPLKIIKTSSNISEKSNTTEVDIILLYILAFLIPVVAVGLVTDWETTPVIISLLLMLLFWVPGIIYALIMVSKNT